MITRKNSAETVWIPTRGLTTPRWIALSASAFLVVAGGLLLYSSRFIFPTSALEAFVILFATLAGFMNGMAWLRMARKVGLSSEGVTIVYPFQKADVPWNELLDLRFVTQGVVVFRPLTQKVNDLSGSHQVTMEQAKAILADSRLQVSRLRDEKHLLRVIRQDSRPPE
ncbi:MAG TPA: hypothetical protein VMC82_00295 [Thermoplasmata archaeon]|nr:hypothetical protein [Thermoplasmata archaeon]